MPTEASAPNRSNLAHALRRLAATVGSVELTAEQIQQLTNDVDGLVDRLDKSEHPERGPWWERGPDYRSSFAEDSPFRGQLHPWSPAMQVHPADASSESSAARADVTLDQRWAGPPNTVHGGVLAGLFDEIIGEAASRAEPHAFTVTGRLAIRYRQPTPLGVPLRLEAAVISSSTRSLTVRATCANEEKITATAEALMVVRRRRRQTKRL